MVSNEILQSGNGHIVIKESEIVLLCELEGDWCWVISHKVLESGDGHIVIQKGEIILGLDGANEKGDDELFVVHIFYYN